MLEIAFRLDDVQSSLYCPKDGLWKQYSHDLKVLGSSVKTMKCFWNSTSHDTHGNDTNYTNQKSNNKFKTVYKLINIVVQVFLLIPNGSVNSSI